MKEINKNNYCPHGKIINISPIYSDWLHCKCCENKIQYEEKLELENDTKLCKVCLTSPIITELLS